MIASLSLILLCQLAGEVIVRGLGLPMPGPVVGLIMLLLLLLARDRFAMLARGPLQGDGVEGASRGLLAHLSLLFIPAGVGVVQRLDVLAGNALAITAALVVSTTLSLGVTAWVFALVARRDRP
jgi:holin-like protein